MKTVPDSRARRLARGLGVASLALGIPQVAAPRRVARLLGVDDSSLAPAVIGYVGARELLHGVVLMVGSPRLVWNRVGGDAIDLALLAKALGDRSGERRTRLQVATAAAVGIAAVDLYATYVASRAQHGKDRPGPLHLDASITVNRSVADVYAYWHDLSHLPTFMRHLKSVTVDGDGRSHWKADAPIRRSVEWDAELTGDEPQRRISWKSLPGADVPNAGTVHFAPSPDREGTEVRVTLHYGVPGGRLGTAVARVFGEEPEQQVRDDLRRFKQVMETGDVVRSDALPHGTDARHQFAQRPAHAPKGGKARNHR